MSDNAEHFVGIVGHGFVGKAVDYGFEIPGVKKFYVDPIYQTTVKHLMEHDPTVVFICVPTPMGQDGAVDSSIVENTLAAIDAAKRLGVLKVIKSTVPPDVIHRLTHSRHDIVYNPEFLVESSAAEQFINPPFHVFGGEAVATDRLEQLYLNYSNCNTCPVFHMTAIEASFVKYAINTFLATKVTFFNQLFDAIQDHPNCNFNIIARAVGADPRIGTGHTKVPGYDMRRGFGGACFPKDLRAFTEFTDAMSLLDKVAEINDGYRGKHPLLEREKTQGITYG